MQHRPIPRAIRGFAFFVRPWVMVLMKRDWQGAENLPTEGGYVLAPNHVSHIDPVLVGHFMIDHDLPPRFLAKDGLFDVPLLGRLMRAAQQIPVYRTSTGAGHEALGAAVAAVEAGEVIIVYPEGTISRDPGGWPMSGRSGAARIALTTGRPLIPMMQSGAQEILRPYTKWPRLFPRKTIRIRVGPAVDLSDLEGQPLTEELLDRATDRLMDVLTAMMAELRGELPTSPRIDVRSLRSRSSTDHSSTGSLEG
ncbi:lysophospholipid acyltransferase family protein [Aeromicrobium sp. CF3.5]|uniref:lysophospholipid acyltransferase family protein n=1 Tax=Aeromicrobium sp. CF3.5 TaxID=3373078 RepID=UPI003EE76632